MRNTRLRRVSFLTYDFTMHSHFDPEWVLARTTLPPPLADNYATTVPIAPPATWADINSFIDTFYDSGTTTTSEFLVTWA